MYGSTKPSPLTLEHKNDASLVLTVKCRMFNFIASVDSAGALTQVTFFVPKSEPKLEQCCSS